ncbi:putative L-gulonolactone oxidase 6 [Senna tora]|uniref:Putative L-gulonolactone oxidase 6 n=1 Tax=Senna tora TaxID=362788 RepID=A0A835CKI8_9FABA|nr:putative L-gulonolactone oxidase 6 [Senna tora]
MVIRRSWSDYTKLKDMVMDGTSFTPQGAAMSSSGQKTPNGDTPPQYLQSIKNHDVSVSRVIVSDADVSIPHNKLILYTILKKIETSLGMEWEKREIAFTLVLVLAASATMEMRSSSEVGNFTMDVVHMLRSGKIPK